MREEFLAQLKARLSNAKPLPPSLHSQWLAQLSPERAWEYEEQMKANVRRARRLDLEKYPELASEILGRPISSSKAEKAQQQNIRVIYLPVSSKPKAAPLKAIEL